MKHVIPHTCVHIMFDDDSFLSSLLVCLVKLSSSANTYSSQILFHLGFISSIALIVDQG